MTPANPEQIRQQAQRRDAVQRAIFEHLAERKPLLAAWVRHQSLEDSLRCPEPSSIVAVVNLNHDHLPTSVRTLNANALNHGDAQWLGPSGLTCPNSRVPPQEATMFCIVADPALKVIALTPPGWNECWTLTHMVDDEEHPDISPLQAIKVAAQAIAPLTHKAVFTSPANLLTPPSQPESPPPRL